MAPHLWFLTSLFIRLTFGHPQFYDQTLCSSDTNYPGRTTYTCSPTHSHPFLCSTFFVYRASNRFPTLADIAALFNLDPDVLSSINNTTKTPSQTLEPGHEVLVPITCSCTGNGSFRANFTYAVSINTTLSEVSCDVFEGLVRSATLAEENRVLLGHGGVVSPGTTLHVPVKCACPDTNGSSVAARAKYLVTYPFVLGDDPLKVSKKFNVSVDHIWRANSMDPMETVYPNTTILVPLMDQPSIDFKISNSDPPTPLFLETTPMKTSDFSRLKNAYIAGSVLIFVLIIALFVASCLALKKFKEERICTSAYTIGSLNSCSTPFSELQTGSSRNSCLSPDLLVGIKYSLCTYTIEDLRRATNDFNVNSAIANGLYKGVMIDYGEVMIKRTTFEGTGRAIDIHSKINHVNIVKLHGVCYGDHKEDGLRCCYLVFEHPCNGSLRDHLTSSSSVLNWLRRMQIAFDIATSLHYLHYSIIPGYTQLNMSSDTIFLSSTRRAKIMVFGTMKGCGSLASWNVPEKIASEKKDIFAFGVVLFELISGKELGDEKPLKESVAFLRGGSNDGGCFDQLRSFVDPHLKDDYPLAEALCLSVLASSCIEDDSMHRPTMDDVLKILARMV